MSRRLLAVAAAATLGTIAFTAGPTSAGIQQDPVMTIDPTEGPPGTEISVEGDQCITKGDTIVEVSLYDTAGDRQDETTADPSDGEWTATLTVPADTTDYGEWRVAALCVLDLDVVQPEGVGTAQTPELFEYEDQPFEVLAPEAPETPEEPAPAPPAEPVVDDQVDFTG